MSSTEEIIQSEQIESSGESDKEISDQTDENAVTIDSNETNEVSQTFSNGISTDCVSQDNKVDSSEKTQSVKSNRINNVMTYEKVPGKRKNTEVFYVPEETQFYRKKTKLSNGLLSAVCVNKSCKKRVMLDESNGTAIFNGPITPHAHTPKKNEYHERKLLHALKEECKNINVIAACDKKTSVIKSIFSSEVDK